MLKVNSSKKQFYHLHIHLHPDCRGLELRVLNNVLPLMSLGAEYLEYMLYDEEEKVSQKVNLTAQPLTF